LGKRGTIKENDKEAREIRNTTKEIEILVCGKNASTFKRGCGKDQQGEKFLRAGGRGRGALSQSFFKRGDPSPGGGKNSRRKGEDLKKGEGCTKEKGSERNRKGDLKHCLSTGRLFPAGRSQ